MHRIKITDETRKILEPLKMVFSSWTETLLAGFGVSERTEIFNYLVKMRENAQNKLDQIKTQE